MQPDENCRAANLGLVRSTCSRLPILRRVLIYGCVGFAVSLFYSLAVIGCVKLLHQVSPTIASIVAFIITLPVAYFAHARISFSDSSNDRFQPLRFAFTTVLSFVVSVGGMYWITEIAEQSFLLGIAWNWLLIPATNFASYVLFAFRTSDAGKTLRSRI